MWLRDTTQTNLSKISKQLPHCHPKSLSFVVYIFGDDRFLDNGVHEIPFTASDAQNANTATGDSLFSDGKIHGIPSRYNFQFLSDRPTFWESLQVRPGDPKVFQRILVDCWYKISSGRMPFLLSDQQCQSTEGKISHSMDLLTRSSPGGLPTLSLTTNSSWLPWGRVTMPLISPLMPVPHVKALKE